MENTLKFLLCNTCGNLATLIDDRGIPLVCCGAPMTELVANTEEASVEKHLPVVEVTGNEVKVAVGSALHPMEESHYISFIYLETTDGGQFKKLKAGDEPKATFCIAADSKPIAAYEYCNLHGLWKTPIS